MGENKRLIFSIIAIVLVGILTGLFVGGGLLPSQAATQQYDEKTATSRTELSIVHAHDGVSQHAHPLITVVTVTETTPHGTFHDFAAAMTPGTNTTADSKSARGPNEVWLVGNNFVPWTITIPVGTKVTWVNKTTSGHTVTSDTDLFSQILGFNSDSFSYTFTGKGVFLYHCTPHVAGGMIGKVIVE